MADTEQQRQQTSADGEQEPLLGAPGDVRNTLQGQALKLYLGRLLMLRSARLG